MRVLILGLNYAPERTGIAPYTTGLARTLADAGHDVHVITGLPHYPEWTVAEAYHGAPRRVEETDGAVRITRVRHPVPARPTGAGRVLMEARWAAAAARVRTPRPDVVLAVSPALLGVGAALVHRMRAGAWHAGRRGGRPALGVIVQDLYAGAVAEAKALGGRGQGPVAVLERVLLGRADGVVAVHEVFRTGLGRAGVAPDRVRIVRNWTHTRTPAAGTDPGTDPETVRAALGWSRDEVIALHAGNMGAKQGLSTVVEAARRADATGARVRFVLMGDGNQRPHLEIRAAGIERLQFVDPLPDGEFEAALAAADVLVLNERPEIAEMCAPSKLTAYFGAGRPVVAATNAFSAAARDMRDAHAGPVVPAGEPDTLLDAVLAVAADPALAEARGRAARSFAASTYSAAAAKAGYLAWCHDLAGLPRRSRTRPRPVPAPHPEPTTPVVTRRPGAPTERHPS